VNGQIVGSYEYFGPGGDGTMGTTDDPFLFPAMFGVVESGARSLLNLAGSFLGDIGGSSAASLARGGIGPVLKGAQGVERAIAEVEAEGGTVLGREITIDTAVARARADFVYRSADGELVVGEAKNGPRAALTANQRAAYQSLKSSGGRFVGGNAAAAGLPSTVGPTTVRVFAYH
jgi:hypothetical protein